MVLGLSAVAVAAILLVAIISSEVPED
jgi:hypothetical protein